MTSSTVDSSPASRRPSIGVSGWRLIAAATVMQAMTAPGQTVGVSAFVSHLTEDLELSRSSVSSAYLIGTLAGALTLPPSGRLIDRRGLRVAVAAFSLGFGLVLAAMSTVQNFVMLALAFGGTRALGQGALSLASTTAVAVGFDRHRGTAMGITAAAGTSIMSLVPLVATLLISQVGWRSTWLVMAVTVWMVLLPLSRSTWLVRSTLPQAEQTTHQTSASGAPASPVWSRADILRTPAFWMVTAAVCLSGLISTGLVFHHVALLNARGLSDAQATANFLPQTIAGAAAAIAAGRAADRVPARWLLGAGLAALAAAPLMVTAVHPGSTAIFYGVLLGAAGSTLRAVEATVLPRWFGTAHIGEIRGLVLGAAVGSTALGPLVLALSLDQFGSYRPALTVLALSAAGLAIVSVLTTRTPDRRNDRSVRPTGG